MQEWLTPLNLAIFGGLIGGLRTVAKAKTGSPLLYLTDVLMGIAAAVGTSHYVPVDAPMSAVIIGMVAGRSAGYVTDVMYDLVPQILPMLIKFLQTLQKKE